MSKFIAITALAMSLAGAPAFAATFSAASTASLTLTGVTLGGTGSTMYTIDEDGDSDSDFFEDGTGAASNAGIATGGVEETDGFGGTAIVAGSAVSPFGEAGSFFDIFLGIAMTNAATSGPMTFSFLLEYALESEVTSSGAYDAAGALSYLDVYSDDEFGIFTDILYEDSLVFAEFDGTTDSYVLTDSLTFDVIVGASATVDLYAEFGVIGGAIAFVPLPATAPLALAALGGLGFLARRRKKAA